MSETAQPTGRVIREHVQLFAALNSRRQKSAPIPSSSIDEMGALLETDPATAGQRALDVFCGEHRLRHEDDRALLNVIFGAAVKGAIPCETRALEERAVALPPPIGLTVPASIARLYVALFNPPSTGAATYTEAAMLKAVMAAQAAADGEIVAGIEGADGEVIGTATLLLTFNFEAHATEDPQVCTYGYRLLRGLIELEASNGSDANGGNAAATHVYSMYKKLDKQYSAALDGKKVPDDGELRVVFESRLELHALMAYAMEKLGRTYHDPKLGELNASDMHVGLLTRLYELPRNLFENVKHRDTLPEGAWLALRIGTFAAVSIAAVWIRSTYFASPARI